MSNACLCVADEAGRVAEGAAGGCCAAGASCAHRLTGNTHARQIANTGRVPRLKQDKSIRSSPKYTSSKLCYERAGALVPDFASGRKPAETCQKEFISIADCHLANALRARLEDVILDAALFAKIRFSACAT